MQEGSVVVALLGEKINNIGLVFRDSWSLEATRRLDLCLPLLEDLWITLDTWFSKNMVTSPTRSLYESPRGYYRQFFFHSSQQFLITYFRPCWLKEVHKKVQRWLLWDIKVKPFDQRLTNSKNNQSRSRHVTFSSKLTIKNGYMNFEGLQMLFMIWID